jgi:hypothetical protein
VVEIDEILNPTGGTIHARMLPIEIESSGHPVVT